MNFTKRYYKFIVLVVLIFGSSCVSSNADELRGVWIRPPATEKEILQILDDLQKARFNTVFIETFYNGHTIYPSNVFPERSDLIGKDFLKLFVEEAHKRNMRIHCWIHTVYWRPSLPSTESQISILDKHPDWLDKNKDGKGTREFENNYDFVSPSIPQVRNLLNQLVEEICRNYKVDGIQLDYIRYAANGDKFGFGYNPYEIQKFKTKYNIDPMILNPQDTPSAWQLWSEFREDQITEIVQSLSSTIHKSNKETTLSASVFPDYYKDRFRNSKLQNFHQWCEKGYLDFLAPMCYSYSTEGIIEEIRMAKKYAGDTPIYPGLAARAGTPHPDFPTQIAIARQENPQGYILFAYNWMTTYPNIFDTLANISNKQGEK